MPAMPRPDSKAKKIALKLLGIPPAARSDKKSVNKRSNQKMLYEVTSRAR